MYVHNVGSSKEHTRKTADLANKDSQSSKIESLQTNNHSGIDWRQSWYLVLSVNN